MSLFERANEIAVLSGGRLAEWKDATTTTGPPTGPSSGVSLVGALKTLIVVDVREDVAKRTARVTILTVDLTLTYRVVVDGNNVDFDALAGGAADREDIIEGIRDAINADGTVNQIVLATGVDTNGDGALDTVLIEGETDADFDIDHSIPSNPPPNGDLNVVADASSVTMRVFAAMGGLTSPKRPDGWRQATESDVIIDQRGFIERFDTASIDRFYVELEPATGPAGDGATVVLRAVDASIGPSILP